MGFISSIKSRLRGYKSVGTTLPNPRLVMPKAPKTKKAKKTPPPKKAKSKPKDRFADTVPLLKNKAPEPMKTRSKMMIPAGRKSGGIIPTATKPRRDAL
jgi:hypothetical protein